MGYYLNSMEPVENYRIASQSNYFVDKSLLLKELFPFFHQADRDICITRPRRFGKTMMAQMIASFFSKATDSSDIFDHLQIAGIPEYRDYRNRYQVIFMDFSKMPRNCKSYAQYIERIEKRLIKDLMKAYPDADIDPEGAVWEALSEVFNEYNGEKFVFVIDEWDCIFHKDFLKKNEQKEFIDFLAGLIKNQAYVAMTYMTGILPIAKYSSGSTINNFLEYTIATQSKFSEYFGFTDQEVDALYKKYLDREKEPLLTRENLREWYDGYHTLNGVKLYNYLRDFERESRRILERTLALDADAVAEALGYIHDSESPHKIYLDESELSSTVKLAYLAARGQYRIEQEDQAGKGYVDYIFYPRNGKDDGLILELKVDRTPEAAIKQIRDKNYALRFQGRMGEKPLTTGRILAVGISCQKGSKKHRCKIEVLQ
ncbi:MAG: ATP-binding protein [Clostridiales bacterium]|nr:ATP-binding protein [Clostridiales bacterium]